MKTALVWFKTDLRLHDNETLIRAIDYADQVIPVYCIDDSLFKMNSFGFKKINNIRTQFILDSLIDLDKNLREIGSGLIVVKGKPEVELLKLATQFDAQRIFTKKEVAYEELQTIDLVEKALYPANCLLETYSTSTLYHALDLPFTLKDIPDIFTNFRKRTEKESTVRKVFETPIAIQTPSLPLLQLPSLKELGLEEITPDKRAVLQFKGGETEALKRLNYYLFETNAIYKYKETRNGMIGDNYSSKFSAWLSQGCLSPKFIYAEIKKYEKQKGANDSTYWLIFELIWRDYFRFIMKKHKHLFFLKNGIKPAQINNQKHNKVGFNKWLNGSTNNAFIDANMIELKRTGFMSNRGRQNVASYLCHQLKLDWRYGAAYFEEQLIDYDVCSNWGNWAYLAGVGTDPMPARVFNIEKQANDYDKNNDYRNLWLTNN